MTTAGLQVTGDAGIIQVDQVFGNFGLSSKGTITPANGAWGAGTKALATLTFTGTNPILALATPYQCFVDSVSVSGSTYTYHLVFATTANGVAIPYYIFDTHANITTSDRFGLEVFDASGNRTFHSSLKVMKVVGTLSGAGATMTPVAGKTYAVATSSFNHTLTSTHLSGNYRIINTLSAPYIASASNTPTMGVITDNYTSASSMTPFNEGLAYALVLDVTNY